MIDILALIGLLLLVGAMPGSAPHHNYPRADQRSAWKIFCDGFWKG